LLIPKNSSNFALPFLRGFWIKNIVNKMDTLSYKTVSANKQTVKKEWFLVDAENEILGRLASKVAMILRGKCKTTYTPHVDCGDNVIVINAEKVRLTGKKLTEKEYVDHTTYPGGQRISTPQEILKKKPIDVIERAVKGMLPKNRLGSEIYRNLHVYAGTAHPHEAQKPKEVKLNSIK
jgi:large subunit ribosomal protein L13